MSAGETSSSYELQLMIQTNQEEVVTAAALLDLHKDAGGSNQELHEIVNNYFVNSVKTREFCAALQQHLEALNTHESLVHELEDNGEHPILPVAVDKLLHDVACVYRQELLMQDRLRSFHNSLVAKIDCIDTRKKACAILFTAASAISAAAAAANANSKLKTGASAASVIFGAVGKWIHSLLEKCKSVVNKRKNIVGAMIMGAKISFEYLTNVCVLAEKLLFEANSVLEMVHDGAMEIAVGEKVAELNNIFLELRDKANDGPNMDRAREVVFRSIITH